MVDAEGVHSGRRVRRWRSAAEKPQIVQLAMAPGASVAEVARAHGAHFLGLGNGCKNRPGASRGQFLMLPRGRFHVHHARTCLYASWDKVRAATVGPLRVALMHSSVTLFPSTK